MRDITVLTTASGSPSAPGYVQCLKNVKERKIRIIATDMQIDHTISQISDAFYQVPAATEKGYIDRLLELCQKEKVDVLIPGMDVELPMLAARRKEFEKIKVAVSVMNAEGIEITNNKIKLYEFMKKHKMKTPRFEKIDNIESFEKKCYSMGYPQKPVCVKVANLSGSRGVRILDANKSRFDLFMNEKPSSIYTTLGEMKKILMQAEVFPEMMVMEYLPGKEYSVDLVAEYGKVVCMGGRVNYIVDASIPKFSITMKNQKAYNIAEILTRKLRLDGNIDFDFKMNENEEPVLLEINPRIAATLGVFAEAGMNLPYIRIKQLLGEPLPECQMQEGVIMRRRYLDSYTNQG